jgi:hypothetical protein
VRLRGFFGVAMSGILLMGRSHSLFFEFSLDVLLLGVTYYLFMAGGGYT